MQQCAAAGGCPRTWVSSRCRCSSLFCSSSWWQRSRMSSAAVTLRWPLRGMARDCSMAAALHVGVREGRAQAAHASNAYGMLSLLVLRAQSCVAGNQPSKWPTYSAKTTPCVFDSFSHDGCGILVG